MVFLSLLLVICSSFGLTWLFRHYALSRNLMDIPNARSSHSAPTPRGGGVAIVITFLSALPILSILGLLEWSTAWALLGAGSCVALLGFLDDHGHIAARWRLLGHFSAAAWALFWLNGLPSLTLFGAKIELTWISNIIAVVYLVWVLNLYNFMDGIDGLASIEAICVCIGSAIIYIYLNMAEVALLPLLLAASVAGFFIWNCPPAKIFMGDAGSGFIGVAIAIMSIKASWVAPHFFWSWIILLGVFIVDATVTLLQRLAQGARVYEAHRNHAYQHASRHYEAHAPITITVALINVLWLFPWAFIVAASMIDGAMATLIAYFPLVILAIKFKAGINS